MLKKSNVYWVLEDGNDLYFAPAAYLDSFAKENGRKIDDMCIDVFTHPHDIQRILEGKILTEKDTNLLAEMTGVSKQTWRNLDETWQKGRIKYLFKKRNKN